MVVERIHINFCRLSVSGLDRTRSGFVLLWLIGVVIFWSTFLQGTTDYAKVMTQRPAPQAVCFAQYDQGSCHEEASELSELARRVVFQKGRSRCLGVIAPCD